MKFLAHRLIVRSGQLAAAATLCAAAVNAQAAFSINLSFTGFSAYEQTYFTTAKSFWESVILDYAAGPLTGINIDASKVPIDGAGGVLGQGGPTAYSMFGAYTYATAGIMEFDTADFSFLLNSGQFGEVVMHEMAHAIGFGTLWEANGLYNEVGNPGRYTGAFALATYKVEFSQPLAAFVPVELGGGPGTEHAHWDEVDDGAGITGILDPMGRDFRNELMTGWLDSPTYVSATTIASFEDLGYFTVLSPIPEVGTVALWLLGVPLIAGLARRRAAA